MTKEKPKNATFLAFLKNNREEEILKKTSVFFMPEPISIKSFFQSNSTELTGGTKSKVFNAMVRIRQVQSEVQKILNMKEANFKERSDNFSLKKKRDSMVFFSFFMEKK